jgi:hypothetical protein
MWTQAGCGIFATLQIFFWGYERQAVKLPQYAAALRCQTWASILALQANIKNNADLFGFVVPAKAGTQ